MLAETGGFIKVCAPFAGYVDSTLVVETSSSFMIYDCHGNQNGPMTNTARAIKGDTELITAYAPLGPADLQKALVEGMNGARL